MHKSDVSEDKYHGKCLKEHSRAFRFENFLAEVGGGGGGRAWPESPLAARAFGARGLPRLAMKSGYGPVMTKGRKNLVLFDKRTVMEIAVFYILMKNHSSWNPNREGACIVLP